MAKQKSIQQKGYAAARRNAPADIAGWCDSKGGGNHHGPKNGAGAPGQGPVVLFGLEDQYVATFDKKTVTVTPFSAIGQDKYQDDFLHSDLEFEAKKVWSAGHGTPLLLYALDTRSQLWSLDFRPLKNRPNLADIGKNPRCRRLAEKFEEPIDNIIVLRRKLILQRIHSSGSYDLHVLDRRTGQVSAIGLLKLDLDIDALDPGRHDILLGREKGEQRLILIDQLPTDHIEVQNFNMPRVTAVTVVNGTHLVLARKGGLLNKVDLRAAVPDGPTWADTHLERVCYTLRRILKRCGYDCDCNDLPGEGGNGGRPEDDEPCNDRHSARIGFTAYKLYRVGVHLVAIDRGATRMAVLDQRLNVSFERKLDRAGATVQPGQPYTQNMLVYLPRKQQIEAWGLADYVGELVAHMPDDFTIVPPKPPTISHLLGPKRSSCCPKSNTECLCISGH